MLLEAARRTGGVASEPQPFVLQTALSDFYVEYELNARLEWPERRVWVQSDLNSNIQDIFNTHGVQIMSPHYLADPPKPQVVPKSNWFLPPATDSSAAGASTPPAQSPEKDLGKEGL
jgi:small-conductance mechanosensitive channel